MATKKKNRGGKKKAEPTRDPRAMEVIRRMCADPELVYDTMDDLVRTLEFYANPYTYYGLKIGREKGSKVAGDFMKDISPGGEWDNIQFAEKPGNRAREALANHVKAVEKVVEQSASTAESADVELSSSQ